jgi:hypothetical protein
MARRLTRNVFAGGQWYGPAYGNASRVPDDVAAGIAGGLWEDGGVAEKVAPADATGVEGTTEEGTDAESSEAPRKASPRRATKGR